MSVCVRENECVCVQENECVWVKCTEWYIHVDTNFKNVVPIKAQHFMYIPYQSA